MQIIQFIRDKFPISIVYTNNQDCWKSHTKGNINNRKDDSKSPDLSKPLIAITKTHPCNLQRFFSIIKIENFLGKKINIFNIFAQNIDCGYTLEPSR